MTKLVVVHHAHHPDEGEEGIFRLIYAQQIEREQLNHEPNPDHDPDDEESEPFLFRRTETSELVDHQEIVWHAGDPKWQGRSAEDIAAEQLQIVKDSITRSASQAERAEAETEESRRTDFGTVGVEL